MNKETKYMMIRLCLFVAFLFGGGMLFAQEQQTDSVIEPVKETVYETTRYKKVWKNRKGYFNFVYGMQSMNFKEDELCVHSDWAAGISAGRTYYLHKRPLLGMIKFGIDWTFFDLQAACFSVPDSEDEDNYYYPDGSYPDYGYEEESYTTKMYKAEIGMQVGPSVTVNPVDHLKIAAYFRVLPCYSALYDGEEFKGGYATYFTFGASVSYKVISLGVEQRWGQNKYSYDYEEEEEEADFSRKVKIKNKGPRFYLSFRF